MEIEKRNAYICPQCRYLTLTVHIHEGVTPFMLKCRNPLRKKCNGMAVSFSYQMPGALALPTMKPTHEWYKPDPDQKLETWEREHIAQGGVLLRERTDAETLKFQMKKP